MGKIQVTLDATKLRELVSNREYTNKDSEVIKLQEVKFELVEVKEPKTIFTDKKGTYRIDKTHFACVIQTKEQRDAKEPTVYIGDGFTTTWLSSSQNNTSAPKASNDIDDDLPF